MNHTVKGFVAAGILAFSGSLLAQQSQAPAAPEIAYDSVDLLKWDDAHIVGEVGGVAQDNFAAGESLPAIMQAYRWVLQLPE